PVEELARKVRSLMPRHVFCRFFFSLFMIWMSGGINRGHAQTLFGSVVGNVKDPTEAVVAGATVTLTNVETKQSRQVTTTDAGTYDFPTIPTGAYDVKITREGFNPHTQTGVLVTANNTVRVDVTLHVGSVAESVVVSGAAALLQTDRADVRSDVTTDQLENLPNSIGGTYQTFF